MAKRAMLITYVYDNATGGVVWWSRIRAKGFITAMNNAIAQVAELADSTPYSSAQNRAVWDTFGFGELYPDTTYTYVTTRYSYNYRAIEIDSSELEPTIF